jgi:hypothetical protein
MIGFRNDPILIGHPANVKKLQNQSKLISK